MVSYILFKQFQVNKLSDKDIALISLFQTVTVTHTEKKHASCKKNNFNLTWLFIQ